MNKLQVSESGKLVTTGNRSLTNMKRKFNALNDNIAMRAQEDEDINNRMKILKCKKKELTAKLDAELKDLKTRKKQLIEERLMLLGERIARQSIIEELLKDLSSPVIEEQELIGIEG